MAEDFPRFPDLPIDSVKKGYFDYIDDNKLSSKEDFDALLDKLWHAPHVQTYVFSLNDSGMNSHLVSAHMFGQIECGATESRWYKHPNYHDDFIRIRTDTDWELEKEIVATQPMYLRTQVNLSEKERRRRELAEAFKELRLQPQLCPDLNRIYGALWVLECEQDCIQGTGFALEGIGLVTCAHVLGSDTRAFRFDSPATKHPVQVLSKHDTVDLAILSLGSSPESLEEGDPKPLKAMEHILVAGHPNYRLGDTPIVVSGLIAGFRMKSGVRRLLTNAPIVAGASGGPVLDGSGKVIGIAVTGAKSFSKAPETEDHGIIPIDALKLLP